MKVAGPAGTGPGELWDAPLATGPLDATVEIPGSKSLTNRYLVLAALAGSPVRLRGALRSRDSELMVAALRALGTEIDDSGTDSSTALWTVNPGPVRGGSFTRCAARLAPLLVRQTIFVRMYGLVGLRWTNRSSEDESPPGTGGVARRAGVVMSSAALQWS